MNEVLRFYRYELATIVALIALVLLVRLVNVACDIAAATATIAKNTSPQIVQRSIFSHVTLPAQPESDPTPGGSR